MRCFVAYSRFACHTVVGVEVVCCSALYSGSVHSQEYVVLGFYNATLTVMEVRGAPVSACPSRLACYAAFGLS